MDADAPNPECPGCRALVKRVASLEAELNRLRGELVKMRALLRQNSSNSSRPPSSDPPGTKRPDKKPRSERARGAQPGSSRSTRELLPPDQVDEIHCCKPLSCVKCGMALHGVDLDPQRHQVTEIPPIEPRVIEYRLHQLICSACGEATRGQLPQGVPEGAFGPRLQAIVALLSGAYRVSRRNIQQILSDFFGVTISLGAVSNLERRMSDALADSHLEALEHVKNQAAVHSDETSWRESGQKSWLWVGASEKVTAFLIRPSRGSEVAKELLGDELEGTLISDRWSGYNWVDIGHRQLCWSHLIRDFRKIAESGGKARVIGEELEVWGQSLFTYWHRVRDGTLDRAAFAEKANAIRKEIKRLLKQGAICGTWRAPSICRGILELEPAMWTFVHEEGVEPTNNLAERAVRPAVIWRKTCMGTQSRRGSEFVERMLTCVATLRRKGRNVLTFLHNASVAALRGKPAPALID